MSSALALGLRLAFASALTTRRRRIARWWPVRISRILTEFLGELCQPVDRELAKFNFGAANPGGEPRLLEVPCVFVDAEYARRAAALHLDGIKSGVAADVEYRSAAQVLGQSVGEPAPLTRRVIAEKMIGGGGDTIELEVVKPGRQSAHAAKNLGLPHKEIASPASHDAAAFSAAGVPTAMIFVRNDHGSHNPDEHMEIADFMDGTAVLASWLAEHGGA